MNHVAATLEGNESARDLPGQYRRDAIALTAVSAATFHKFGAIALVVEFTEGGLEISVQSNLQDRFDLLDDLIASLSDWATEIRRRASAEAAPTGSGS